MRCPFFEEVLVAFCRAYPVKKMVPSDRIQANCICTCETFADCSLFQEVMARVEGTRAGAEESGAQRDGERSDPERDVGRESGRGGGS